MIEVTLYTNKSETNVVHKELNIIGTYTGSFRDSVSVTDPEVVIETDAILAFVNYAHIPYLGRYFFVNGITIVRTGLYHLRLHVDVLSTYWDSIKLLRGIVGRQENLYNLYLDDDQFIVKPQRIYTTIAFPNRVGSGSGADNGSFVLTLAGGKVDEEVI